MADYVSHPQRMAIGSLAPAAYRAQVAFDTAALAGVDRTVAELVRLRVSQLNGCAYCVDMHTREALAAGEQQRRLTLVATWREAPLFTARERAALELAEAVTLQAQREVDDELWQEAQKHFPQEELAHLVLVIAAMNTWNRIAVTARNELP